MSEVDYSTIRVRLETMLEIKNIQLDTIAREGHVVTLAEIVDRIVKEYRNRKK